MLDQTREALLETLAGIDAARADEVPSGLEQRGWRFRDVAFILAWHEPHHQGQAHQVKNLYLNRAAVDQ